MTGQPPQSSASGVTARLSGSWIVALVLGVFAIPLAIIAFRSEGRDFRAFYVAAAAVTHHLDPYADNHQSGAQFVDVANENGISRWIYPPSALFFVTPLARFSFTTAKALFNLLSIASLAWILFVLGRKFRIAPAWLALAFVSLPAIACIQRGQIDILVLLCVFLAYRLEGRSWAGIPLGLAISIKIFPAALLLWWLLERKFREVTVAIVFTLLLGLTATWRFHPSSYLRFLHNLTTLHSQVVSPASSLEPNVSYITGDFRLPHISEPWFALRQGFLGSYNNPLVLVGNFGIVLGFLFAVAAAFFLRYKRVSPEVGFFSMVLLSQVMNTSLWTMGMVMYIPICLIAISKLRSYGEALMFLVPLYLPSQLRILGVTPRLVVALALIGWLVIRTGPLAASESSDLAQEPMLND